MGQEVNVKSNPGGGGWVEKSKRKRAFYRNKGEECCFYPDLVRKDGRERRGCCTLEWCFQCQPSCPFCFLYLLPLLSLFFFSFCQTPLDFWNALRRDWFTLTQHMLFLLGWLIREGADYEWELLCWALYEHSFRPEELVLWLDEVDTSC